MFLCGSLSALQIMPRFLVAPKLAQLQARVAVLYHADAPAVDKDQQRVVL